MSFRKDKSKVVVQGLKIVNKWMKYNMLHNTQYEIKSGLKQGTHDLRV